MRVVVGNRGVFSRLFLLSLIISAFYLASVGAEVLVADFTENDLEGYMTWLGFLDHCNEGGSPYSGGGYFDSISVHLEIDTDKETLTGTLSGSGGDSRYPHAYTQEHSFVGTISGTAKRVHWAGYFWRWELKADVELDLSFSTSYRCSDSTGEYYWKSREDTAHITRVLTAPTASENNQEFMYFQINWETPEQQATPQIFFMTHKNEDEDGRAILPLEMPNAIDLDVEISGPEQIGRGDSGATFDLEVKGEDSDRVQNVRWYFYYFDEAFDEYWWFESFERQDLTDLVINASKIEEWMEYLDDYGTTVDGEKVLPMQLYAELEAGEFEWLTVSQLYNFTYTSADVVEQSRNRLTGFGFPIKHMEIEYSDGEQTLTTTTDENGYYSIPKKEDENYQLKYKFKYIKDDVNFFYIASFPPHNYQLQVDVKKGKIDQIQLIPGSLPPITYKTRPSNLETLELTQIMTKKNAGSGVVSIYQHTTEALEFYRDILHEDLSYLLPLPITPFVDNPSRLKAKISYSYKDDQHMVLIDEWNSIEDSIYRPKSREYHEFSHFAMRSIYHTWPKAPEGPIKEKNHAGYINPSTADSYVEGFAYFMSVIIGDQYSSKWGDLMGRTDKPDPFGSLEINKKAWENAGASEEWAIAGILWDLYDGPKEYEKLKEEQRQAATKKYNELIEKYDIDNDGVYDRVEMIWHEISKSTLDFAMDLAKLDTNSDNKIDLAELSKDESESYAKEFMEKFDKNKNNVLEPNETSDLIREKLKEQAIEVNKNFQEFPEFQKFPEGITLNEYISEIQNLKDDDKVDLSFEEIWKILRTPHNDFTSVYEAFKLAYPEKIQDIDDIFISHGFWVDTNEGNGQWDRNEPSNPETEYFIDYPEGGFIYEGEKVGTASNYQRKDRRSGGYLAGHYLMVDNEVPFYTVTHELFDDDFIGGALPYDVYSYEVRNQDGGIYLAIPSESQDAVVSVEPYGVQYDETFTFTNQEFYANYSTHVDNDYFIEHHFEIIGEIPEAPIDTLSGDVSGETVTSPDTEQNIPDIGDQNKGIPSFPVASIVIGITLILLIHRKRI